MIAMAYSDFTLKKVKADFQLETIENLSLFADIAPVELSEYLLITLARNVPLALSINTEKARSELIIINILLEVKEKLATKVSLFSGIDFTVDKERGLTGFCDYIISHSPEQLYLESPVITIVEAKNENIVAGLGQCIAEMVAAQLFNQKDRQPNLPIYGAVTSGDEWKFIKLVDRLAYIDRQTYYMSDIKQVVGILVTMAKQEA
jgi:hypothetical protein